MSDDDDESYSENRRCAITSDNFDRVVVAANVRGILIPPKDVAAATAICRVGHSVTRRWREL